jgi:hypothetical protein
MTATAQRTVRPLVLAIGPRGSSVFEESQTLAGYEANLDCSNWSGCAGNHTHNQCRRLPRRRLLWWRWLPRRWLVWRRLLRRRLELGYWLGLLRLWLGNLSWLRRAGLLRRLPLRPGLCCARLRHSGVRRARLHYGSLCQAGLHHSGLPRGAGSSNRGRREHGPGNADLNQAGLCLRSRHHLCGTGLC